MIKLFFLTCIFIHTLIGFSHAQNIDFSQGWKHQGFFPKKKNEFLAQGTQLNIQAERSVSMLYKPLEKNAWHYEAARWQWQVNQGVPPTNLQIKGGDDRNIALYFVFLNREDAEKLKKPSITKLLNNKNARVLVYVWGGHHEINSVLQSPYLGSRGRTIVLQNKHTGTAVEEINLRLDYQNIFGNQDVVLYALALSADADDTESQIRAQISNLTLK